MSAKENYVLRKRHLHAQERRTVKSEEHFSVSDNLDMFQGV